MSFKVDAVTSSPKSDLGEGPHWDECMYRDNQAEWFCVILFL